MQPNDAFRVLADTTGATEAVLALTDTAPATVSPEITTGPLWLPDTVNGPSIAVPVSVSGPELVPNCSGPLIVAPLRLTAAGRPLDVHRAREIGARNGDRACAVRDRERTAELIARAAKSRVAEGHSSGGAGLKPDRPRSTRRS